ncbi:MAG: sodium:solute symporter family protein, partial [Calditrichaeota bacterium]|nr:sodium:solute symporter family protein [Calditrichota bacterium]
MIIYLLITIAIGLTASRFVKNAEDFVLAGRRLPLMLASTAVFATWFGSETVMGASSEFVQHGLLGVIEDPFGASLCLLLVGIFFARPIYRMNILTFGDFYRIKFDQKVELLAGIFMVVSYFGWIAAQLVAMGIIMNVVLGIPLEAGILTSAGIVLLYTYIGGMWSISITDFMQTIIIIAGLLFLLIEISGKAGGLAQVIAQAPADFFRFTPDPEPFAFVEYLAAWITIGLGSIPQQDVFQRVMSARSENVAVRASYVGSLMYLTIAFIPLLIGLSAKVVYPELMA